MAGPFNLRASQLNSISSNLVFTRGEDITVYFQLTPVVDITGWTLNMNLAPGYAVDTVLTKAPTVIDGPRGRFSVAIANADTSSLTVGRYVWDIRREDSGHATTVADGIIDLRQEVTP
jgi:hypothetical protein